MGSGCIWVTAWVSLFGVHGALPGTGDEDGQDPEVRISEPLVDTDALWLRPGFRIRLGFAFETIEGRGPAPGARGLVPMVQVGWRLREQWELLATWRYSIFTGAMTGYRWSATLEPVFYPVRGLILSLGGGYAGLRVDRAVQPPFEHPEFLRDEVRIDISGREPHTELPPLNKCDGDGVIAVGRLGYLVNLAEFFATGPSLYADAQWTRCTDPDFLIFVPEGQDEGVPHQWWFNASMGFAWQVAWR